MPMHGFSIVAPAESTAGAAPQQAPAVGETTTTTTQQQGGDGGETSNQKPAPGWTGVVPILVIFVIMYLLLIRPQQKRQKEHRELVSRLKAGDRVMTNGGIYGTIVSVKDASVMIRIADGVEIEVIRSAVNAVVAEKGDAAKA